MVCFSIGLHPQSRTNSQSRAVREIHHFCHTVKEALFMHISYSTEYIFNSLLVCLCYPRYDVELFQRIETLIGKKLPAFPTQEEEVMMLVERVSEAQRFARLVSQFNTKMTSSDHRLNLCS